MKDIKIIAEDDHGLTAGQIEGALRESLRGRTLKRVLTCRKIVQNGDRQNGHQRILRQDGRRF